MLLSLDRMLTIVLATASAAVLVAPSAAAVPHPQSVEGMFAALRSTPATTLPRPAAQTLRRLRARPPGNRVQLQASHAWRIGPQRAALYLVPGANGVCVVRLRRGLCSDDLDAISAHGIRFATWEHTRPGRRATLHIYGALPDGLGAISVLAHYVPPHRGKDDLIGTNAVNSGYRVNLPMYVDNIMFMLLTGPRGGATLGPCSRTIDVTLDTDSCGIA